MSDTEKLVITLEDRLNPLWPRIERHLKDQVRFNRAKLEGPQDIDETNRLRGRIAAYKAMLECAGVSRIIED